MQQYLTKKWIIAALLATIAVCVMVRLGFWQLDRLAQRRALNARVRSQINAPALVLDAAAIADPNLPQQLIHMQYRQVKVRGTFDYSQQVALRNQAYNQEFGVHLLAPLKIEGSSQSILIDRGWIPQSDFDGDLLEKYDQPGVVDIQGVIQYSRVKPSIGNQKDVIPLPGQGRLEAWYAVNLPGIAQQLPYPLLPVYLQQMPMLGVSGPPYQDITQPELTDGSHLSFAIQWFFFAAVLAFGFPFYVSREIKKEKVHKEEFQMQGA